MPKTISLRTQMISVYLRLAFKELRYNLRFSLVFILNLALGLSGLAAIDSLKISISEALSLRAKGILAADFSVGARRPLTDSEAQKLTQILPDTLQASKVFESFTMVSTPSNSRLVELKAIEKNYPFYGEIQLQNAGLITSASKKDIFDGYHVWVYPELLTQLGIELGDKIKIGSIEFTVTDTILRDSAGVGAGFSFAPPIYLSHENFTQTGLFLVGSTGYFATLYKVPTDKEIQTEEQIQNVVKNLVQTINTQLPDPAIRVQTSQNASEQVGRMLGYLGDYLGLAGLVALFLTALGQIFLYRSYIIKRRRDIAIFKSIGLSASGVFWIYASHILLLGAISLIPTLFFSSILLPSLSQPVSQLIQIQFDIRLQTSTFLLIFFTSLIGALLVCVPLLIRALQVRARDLLNPVDIATSADSKAAFLYYVPALLSYYIVSLWLAKSYITGSVFFVLFMSTLLLLAGIGYVTLQLIDKNILNRAPSFSRRSLRALLIHYALRNMVRSKLSTLSALTTLGLGVAFANLIPHLEKGIRAEIEAPPMLEQPSLFLFDIQPEQKSGLDDLLSQLDVKVMQSSPMIRSRLTHVNNQPFEKRYSTGEETTREEENENRFRNRGFNLTYRRTLSRSEKIIAGKDFSALTNASASGKPTDLSQISQPETQQAALPLPVSIEFRFAKRLGLNLGDVLTFDVQSVPVEAQIVNLRRVRWTSFQPNFFIQFDDDPAYNPLRDAPQTFLTTLGPMSNESKLKVQTQVVQKYPNVSIVDVTRLVERLSGIIAQMSFALKVMAWFTILVGLMILFSILNHQVYERKRDINLLKILGARFEFIRKLFLYEFLLLCGSAIFIGTILSFLLGQVMALQFFDSAFRISVAEPIVLASTLLFVCFLITISVTHRVLKSRPVLEAER